MVDGTGQSDLDRVLDLVAAAHRGARRPSPNCVTWPAASTPRYSTAASASRSPPSPRGATCPSRSSWTCPSGRRPRSRPSPTSVPPSCWARRQAQRRPACHAGGRPLPLACYGSGSRTTAPAAPASRPAAAWPGCAERVGTVDGGLQISSPPGGPTVVHRRAAVPRLTERGARPDAVVIADDSAVLGPAWRRFSPTAATRWSPPSATPATLLAAVAEHHPDAAVVDVRMPPGYTDEGLRAAIAIRRDHPGTGVLVFSQYIETRYAADLLGAASGGGAAGVGYLLKDRVADVDEFVDALSRVAAGGTALDPEVVTQLLGASRRTDGLTRAHPQGTRGARADGRGPLQRRDRRDPGGPEHPSKSTSATSSASSAWPRRTPTTAGCWRSCAIWSPDPSGGQAGSRSAGSSGRPASARIRWLIASVIPNVSH